MIFTNGGNTVACNAIERRVCHTTQPAHNENHEPVVVWKNWNALAVKEMQSTDLVKAMTTVSAIETIELVHEVFCKPIITWRIYILLANHLSTISDFISGLSLQLGGVGAADCRVQEVRWAWNASVELQTETGDCGGGDRLYVQHPARHVPVTPILF